MPPSLRRPLCPLRHRQAWALMGGWLCALHVWAGDGSAGKMPPPLSVFPLAGARVTVYTLPASGVATGANASVCSTTAGYCPVPGNTTAGFKCVCEAADGSYMYAGHTGEVPPMPVWADPNLKRR